MGYYLQWSQDSGIADNNNELLQISGIVGAIVSIEYRVRGTGTNYNGNSKYIFDGRRRLNTVDNGGDSAYLYQSTPTSDSAGTSDYIKNGIAVPRDDFFATYNSFDVFKFSTSVTPSEGVIAFGARFNEVQHWYGLAVDYIIVTDANGAHTIDMSSSAGTGTTLTSTDSALTATLFNFPVDDSQWVFYDETVPTEVPTAVSGSLAAGDAAITWESNDVAATFYEVEFRRRN